MANERGNEDTSSEVSNLSNIYSEMSNEELYQLAANNDELTPQAQSALEIEMHSRNLDADKNPYVGKDVIEYVPLVTLRRFDNAMEAEIAQSLLQSYSIPATIAGNDSLPFGSSLPVEGGIRLQVSPANLMTAVEILAAPPAEVSDEGAAI